MKTVKTIKQVLLAGHNLVKEGSILDVYDTPYFTKAGVKYYEIVTSGKRKFILAEFCVPTTKYFLDESLFEI
jgi:hypothetical protein